MERKLASIQIINNISPIENADNIERIDILGWHLVAKKGEFSIGDTCVFIEVDSVLPEKTEFDFLKDVNYRIKTRKFRQQVSQGICFPISILPTGTTITEGEDVTELLGVTKWEPQLSVHLSGLAKGNKPSFFPKTDETRIQSIPFILDKYRGMSCYIAEKLDGGSASIYYKDGDFGVCSRNMDLKDTEDNVYWSTVKKLNIDTKLNKLNSNICLQGELIGPGIQKNKYNLKDYKIYFFNVFDIDKYKYLDYKDFIVFINKLELDTVPIITDNFLLDNTVDDLVQLSTNISKLNNIYREGIVIRPIIEVQDNKIGRLSFKVVSPQFLLKFNE